MYSNTCLIRPERELFVSFFLTLKLGLRPKLGLFEGPSNIYYSCQHSLNKLACIKKNNSFGHFYIQYKASCLV